MGNLQEDESLQREDKVPKCPFFRVITVYSLGIFIIQEIESSVERKDQHFKEGPLSPFEFNDEEEEIHLALPEIPILGWTMKYLNSDKVRVLALVIQ